MNDDYIEIERDETVWRFERDFLSSNWTCLFGKGCKGILRDDATELNQGCCSLGAHFGDGPAGDHEAMQVQAYASMLTAEQFQFFAVAHDVDATGDLAIYGDVDRTHTRVVDDACIFLNRPGFTGGEGCALHIAAVASGESPTEWKPSVCWQLPLRIDWQTTPTAHDPEAETATVRRWTRADWGDHGTTMAWCCTERSDGGEAFAGETAVIDSLADELTALAGHEVYVELRRKLSRRGQAPSRQI